MTVDVRSGDALEVLQAMDSASVDACVTSPPYWRLRDYGHDQQLGMEPDVDSYIDRLATVFDEVFRVLKPSGTCWVNLGDSYIVPGGGGRTQTIWRRRTLATPPKTSPGLKTGDLALVPARFSIECQRRGWWIRQEIAWHKPNAAVDCTTSRPMRSHEHLFMMTKAPSGKYYYNADAVLQPLARKYTDSDREGRHIGSVWTIGVRSNPARIEHYAMQTDEVARRCILLGSPEGGTVLDPFLGSGTTIIAARRLGRVGIGIELVAASAELARRRISRRRPAVLEGAMIDQELSPS